MNELKRAIELSMMRLEKISGNPFPEDKNAAAAATETDTLLKLLSFSSGTWGTGRYNEKELNRLMNLATKENANTRQTQP